MVYLLSFQILPPIQPVHLSEVDPPSPSLPLLLVTPLYSRQLFLERKMSRILENQLNIWE